VARALLPAGSRLVSTFAARQLSLYVFPDWGDDGHHRENHEQDFENAPNGDSDFIEFVLCRKSIRFDTIERNGIEQPIALKPVDDGDLSAHRVPTKTRPEAMERPEGAGLFVFAESGNLALDQKFHSEWETR
jgi:hypothetical protein